MGVQEYPGRSGVPAWLFESVDSSAPLGAQSHRHSAKIGVLRHAHSNVSRNSVSSLFSHPEKRETSEVIEKLLTVVSRMPAPTGWQLFLVWCMAVVC